jgi:uncharacterized membrane protein
MGNVFVPLRKRVTIPNRIKTEFGKWLMDVAKYLITAVVFSTVFSSIKDEMLMYVVGIVSALATLGIGLTFLIEKNNDDRTNNCIRRHTSNRHRR